jgi:endonuclease III
MKTMVKSAGLDTTNKVHTNQSLSKTLVRKLKKGGAQSHEIMAILQGTGTRKASVIMTLWMTMTINILEGCLTLPQKLQ